MNQNILTGDQLTGFPSPPLSSVCEDPLRQAPTRSQTILLADDDLSVRQLIGGVLLSENYTVVCARTGREAAESFLSSEPNLVLMDLNMPVKDGWEAFTLMNAINPLVPVILITARPGQQEKAHRMGVDALMEKPLDLMLLLEMIHKFLAESVAERIRRRRNQEFKPPI